LIVTAERFLRPPMMSVGLDVAGRDVGNRLLTKRRLAVPFREERTRK